MLTRTTAINLVLLFLCALGSSAPSSQTVGTAQCSPSSQDAACINALPTIVYARLKTNLSARRAKPGGRVIAEVLYDVTINHQIVVRRKSKLVGHIVEVQRRSRRQPESRLGFVFDIARVKNGPTLRIVGVAREVSPYDISGPVTNPPLDVCAITGPGGQCQEYTAGDYSLESVVTGPPDQHATAFPGRETLITSRMGNVYLPGWHTDLTVEITLTNNPIAN